MEYIVDRLNRIVALRTAQQLLDCPRTPERIRQQQLAIVAGYRNHA